MKKIFIFIASATVFFAGCSGSNKVNDDKKGTHVHEDGSVHNDHKKTSDKKQEEFTVPVDSSVNRSEHEHKHTHDGHDQPHIR